jgi:regulator of sirC expression with transglutaminase-like and TPR domain
LLLAAVMSSVITYIAVHKPSRRLGRVELRPIQQRIERLTQRPCDQSDILELTEMLLVEVGDAQSTLRYAHDYFRDCGPWPRLRQVTYRAHEKLQQHNAALRDADYLISTDPRNPEFWRWRGDANAGMREDEAAVEDYRRALRLQPWLREVPFALADVQERLGRPCDAKQTLEAYCDAHPQASDDLITRARLDGLGAACKTRR